MINQFTLNASNAPFGGPIVMSLVFLIAVFLFFIKREQKSRLYAMIACLFCLIGDIFLALSTSWRVIAGGVSFVIAHIILGIMFVQLFRKEKLKVINWGFIVGIAIGAITLIIMEVLAFTIVASPNVLNACLVPFYILAITFNMSLNFSYSINKKGTFYFLMLGMAIFYMTDVWVFLEVLNISSFMSGYIWYFYQVGQLLIVLFNAPLEFKKNNQDPQQL